MMRYLRHLLACVPLTAVLVVLLSPVARPN